MKKLLLTLFIAFFVFSPLDLKASDQGEEVYLFNIRNHETLRAPFDVVFKKVYDNIEDMTGCKTSQISLIHWLNKDKEETGGEKLFNFDRWREFNISNKSTNFKGFFNKIGIQHKDYDPNDENMIKYATKEQQMEFISYHLYQEFYALTQNHAKIIEFKNHLKL